MRASALLTSYDKVISSLGARGQDGKLIPIVLITKIDNKATSKTRRAHISEFFDTGSGSRIIGLADTDELIVTADSPDELRAIERKLSQFEENDCAVSCIDDFKNYSPKTKIVEGMCNYKITLLNYQDDVRNGHAEEAFEDYLRVNNISFRKTDYSKVIRVYKLINLGQNEVQRFTDDIIFDSVFSIEPMPSYGIKTDSADMRRELPVRLPQEGANYVTVGLLDGGVSAIPHLSPWIDDSYSPYPSNLLNRDHGTFVAGIIQYGDELENKFLVGKNDVRIFDAAVVPDLKKEHIDEDELINNVRDAVKLKSDKIKIWNLCISANETAYLNRFSELAIALDEIQDEYGILINKSAGNCACRKNEGEKERISAGADSVRSLVVGSVAHEKNVHDYSEVDHPSPFSRIGPGPEYIIKPDVCHYGGNCGSENGCRTFTGVKSFSADGGVRSQAGTSFSTPRVSALAAALHQRIDCAFDPLLIKALIVHSAKYPETFRIDGEKRINEMGFGIPADCESIIHTSDSECTMIINGTLKNGERLNILDFPMPECLVKDDYFIGQITVTLAYSPLLDPTQGPEYCQSNINVLMGTYGNKIQRMSRGVPTKHIDRSESQNLLKETLFSKVLTRNKTDEFGLRERTLIQNKQKYCPIKKYAIDLSDVTKGNKEKYLSSDRSWFLTLDGTFRDNAENKTKNKNDLQQKYSLIITIKDSSKTLNVYSGVIQKINQNNFIQNSIVAEERVSIPVRGE